MKHKSLVLIFSEVFPNKTMYQLTYYIDLIEQRPRSVFNAKPVKSNVSAELMEIGKRLSGSREMVKLLRLIVDYGEDMVLANPFRIIRESDTGAPNPCIITCQIIRIK